MMIHKLAVRQAGRQADADKSISSISGLQWALSLQWLEMWCVCATYEPEGESRHSWLHWSADSAPHDDALTLCVCGFAAHQPSEPDSPRNQLTSSCSYFSYLHLPSLAQQTSGDLNLVHSRARRCRVRLLAAEEYNFSRLARLDFISTCQLSHCFIIIISSSSFYWNCLP